MKKIVLVMAIALAAVGIVSAQSRNGVQTASVQGTLGLQNGVIVLSSGNMVYYVPELSRYVGFIDALKEGAQVKVEGWQMGNGYITPSKITVGGKDYDLSSNGYGNGGVLVHHGSGYGHRGGGGHGHGGGCYSGDGHSWHR
jgi:hypothetical protein